tara:strand:- start:1572 stop:1814 length:243 start_codon:yes stop_codon:yes gene_type:complete
MEKEKTTPEEVETLREKNKKVIDFLIQLGDIESSLYRLENKKTSIMYSVEGARKDLHETQSTLIDKYGEKSINLETGELQ